MKPKPNLSAEIMRLMERRGASREDGATAISTALIVCLVHDGFTKDHALGMFGDMWDLMEPKLSFLKEPH